MSKLNRYRVLLAGASLLAAGMASSGAQASLIGNTIKAEYNFPSLGGVYGGFSVSPSDTFVVGAGDEGTAFVDGLPYTIDFDADSLTLTLPSVGFSGGSFNGTVFSQILGDLFPSISSVTGVPFANVISTGTQLSVNWQGQSFNEGDKVVVNFGDAGVVPEPATWAMMIGGFGLVGGAMRYRRGKRAVSFA